MNKSCRPNIFHFATSELSQDAFICWLLSWATNDFRCQDTILEQCARNLVLKFFQLFPEKQYVTSTEDIIEVTELKRQYEKIDVYFQVKTRANKTISFIIEDKTNTSHHSNQLQRYCKAVDKDKLVEDDTLGIYFKTGFIFSEDEELPDAYKLFRREDFLEIFGKCESQDRIFIDYQNYLQGMQDSFETAIEQVNKALECGEHFRRADIQWTFLKEVFTPKAASIHEAYQAGKFNRGTNNDGRPWTNFTFHSIPVDEETAPGISDEFFWRLDYRINKTSQNWSPYLCLRAYNWYGDKKKDKGVGLRTMKRRHRYLQLFNEACDELKPVSSGFNLEQGQCTHDYSGNYEAEIGIFFFDEDTNTPRAMKEQIPIVHELFCQELISLDASENYYLSQLQPAIEEHVQQILPKHSKPAWHYYEYEGELVEIKISTTNWDEIFGSGKLVVMIYQYATTPGIAVRAFMASDVATALKQKFKTATDAAGIEIHLKPVSGWNNWTRIFDRENYPSGSFCPINDFDQIVENITSLTDRLITITDQMKV